MSQTTEPKQGSREWLQLRMGRVTASRFAVVMTQPRTKAARQAGEPSETAKGYLYELVAEMLWLQQAHSEEPPADLPKHLHCLWGPPSVPESIAMAWGSYFEHEALEVYANYFGVDVERPGFLVHPDRPLVGCSPDGLIGEDEIVEVKCLGMARHARILLTGEMPDEYVAQVQGNLWVTGRKLARFISYDPRVNTTLNVADDGRLLVLATVNIPRDEEFIEHLEEAVDNFLVYYRWALEDLGLVETT